MSQDRGRELSEERLREIAGGFPYPPTPDVAGRVRRRLREERRAAAPARLGRPIRVALALLILLLGISAVMVPEVRALARAIFRLGSVEIVVATPTPPPATLAPGTATPIASAAAPALQGLVGETTLEQAQRQVPFPLRLPAHPPDLGRPDRVFLQNPDGPAVILVWLDPTARHRPRMSLSYLTSDVLARKTADQGTLLQETAVSGARALWLRGPHILEYFSPDGRVESGPRRLVEGNVLLWAEGSITYRLEVDPALSLQEAIRVAESLAPVPGMPQPAPNPSLAGLAGETTLQSARQRVRFPVRLPAYPAGLGEPDRVFVQDMAGQAVILAWTVEGQPDQARLSLWILTRDTLAEKTIDQTTELRETLVDGRPALWIRGPHLVRVRNVNGLSDWAERRLVEGNVLVWEESGLTYRLETELSLEEAVRVAESLE